MTMAHFTTKNTKFTCDFKKDYEEDTEVVETTSNSESTVKNFTDVSFDDIA